MVNPEPGIRVGDAPPTNNYDAIIVGAGVAGLYQLHRLRERGYSVRVLEAGSAIGGTWFWNRYPGCRFDSESYTYQYSFSKELLEEWDWTEHFSPQPETLRYLNFVSDKLKLHNDIQLNARVKSALFDEVTNRWNIETDKGERFTAHFTIMATGLLSTPKMPSIEGIDDFKGESFHTYHWPHDPKGWGGKTSSLYGGKRVAVIGTGATAVQLIPHLGESVEQLYVFQRTPNWTSPLHNSKITAEEQPALKARYQEIFNICETTYGAFMHELDLRSVFDVSKEEREAHFESLYNKPGFAIWLSNFADTLTDIKANDLISDFMADKIRQRVNDQNVAEKLIPVDHGFGQRRIAMETHYYEAYNRDNVTLIDVNDAPIERITKKGIKTSDKEYEVDLIIYATGFDAATGAMRRIDIRGLGGRTIQDKWSQALKTYMGLQIEGFPNMFTHAGPHAAFCNIPRCVQFTVDWATDLMDHMRDQGLERVMATEEAETGWTKHAAEQAEKILLGNVRSWMTGENIEGKPHNFLLYSGPTPSYRRKLARCAANDYDGFTFE